MEWKGTKMHTETIANKAVVATRHHLAQWYGLDDRGFESRQGLGIFLIATASRPALGPTQPPIQWVPDALSLITHLHLVPRSRMRGAVPPLPSTPSFPGAQLKHGQPPFRRRCDVSIKVSFLKK
jgi:hypothetical protein